MGSILPETYVHAMCVLGEKEVNSNSHGNVPPYQGIICLYVFYCQTPDLGLRTLLLLSKYVAPILLLQNPHPNF